MRQNTRFMSFEEELMLFYNKYLFLDLGEGFLTDLIKKCVILWENKREKHHDLNHLEDFRFTYEDYNTFYKTERDFLNFYPTACIKLADNYSAIINEMGNIKEFVFDSNMTKEEEIELNKYLHMHILDFIRMLPDSYDKSNALEEAEEILLQNILTSKIYKVVYEVIRKKRGLTDATLFALANNKIVKYDDEMQKMIKYDESFKTRAAMMRSRR